MVTGLLGVRAAVFLSWPALNELNQVCRCLSDYAGRPLADLGPTVDVNDPYGERFFHASLRMTATIRDELEQGRLAANPPPALEAGLA